MTDGFNLINRIFANCSMYIKNKYKYPGPDSLWKGHNIQKKRQQVQTLYLLGQSDAQNNYTFECCYTHST